MHIIDGRVPHAMLLEVLTDQAYGTLDPLALRCARRVNAAPVWLFDLDNTLHDASHAAFAGISESMTDYIVEHLGLEVAAATALRQHYWHRYGATLLGMVRHHGVRRVALPGADASAARARGAAAQPAPTTGPPCGACPGASTS